MQRSPSPAVYYVFFFFTGIATTLLGVLVPNLHLSLTDAQIGRLLATQFTGQLLGALLVTKHAKRSLIAGVVLTFLSALWMSLASSIPMAVLFFYGLGLGISMTAANIVVGTEALPEQRDSRMEMLNFFWPLGAGCSPWCVRLAGGDHASLRVYLLIAATFLVMLPAFLLQSRKGEEAHSQGETTTQETPFLHLLRFCLLGLLAVGVESSLSSWAPTFGQRYFQSAFTGGVAASAFWAGILGGRVIASFALKQVRWASFSIWSSVVCAIAVCGLAASRQSFVLFTTALIGAFCISPIYPAVLSHAVHLRGKNFVFFSAGIGSAFVPWMVGTASLHTASLRMGMLVPVFGSVLLAVMFWPDRRSYSA